MAKLLIPLVAAAVLCAPASGTALAQKSLLVPEAYPKVEKFNPKLSKPANAPRRLWLWRHGYAR